MTDARWRELMENEETTLTAEELTEGWHFCYEWDGLLVGPGMMEMEICKEGADCLKKGSTSA